MTQAVIRPPATSIVVRIQAYAGAIALVALSTLAGLWVAPRWGTDAVDMIYLPAVLAAAALWGLGPALLSGAGAALAYNFFFTEPVHTFRMNRADDIVTVIVLLSVALVTSKLAAAIRDQARLAAAHAARNATIAGFAHHLLSCSSEEEIARSGCAELNRLFQCNAMLVAGTPSPHIVAAVPDGNRLTPSDVAAAALTIESGEPAGVIGMRVAVEDDLDVSKLETERGDVRFDLRRRFGEAAVDQDQAARRRDQVRRHVGRANVIHVPGDPERRDRLILGCGFGSQRASVGRQQQQQAGGVSAHARFRRANG